jgi:hypothetical protein
MIERIIGHGDGKYFNGLVFRQLNNFTARACIQFVEIINSNFGSSHNPLCMYWSIKGTR